MRKIISIIILLVIVIMAGLTIFFLTRNTSSNTNQSANTNSQPTNLNANISVQNVNNSQNTNASNNANFQPPLDKAGERVTKKPFGLYITPQNSPVQPERFSGYHTGADFEIFPEELNMEVSVKAVCSGTLKLKETASGYGGVAVQNCELNESPITVVYGHLKLSSIRKKSGENYNVGETLGILGADKSPDTDGERKHLHLGFHKSNAINIKGYVKAQSQLSDWIDPCLYICHN